MNVLLIGKTSRHVTTFIVYPALLRNSVIKRQIEINKNAIVDQAGGARRLVISPKIWPQSQSHPQAQPAGAGVVRSGAECISQQSIEGSMCANVGKEGFSSFFSRCLGGWTRASVELCIVYLCVHVCACVCLCMSHDNGSESAPKIRKDGKR